MKGLTNYITECLWSDILVTLYVVVDDTYQELPAHLVPRRQHTPGGAPRFSDSEVITECVKYFETPKDGNYPLTAGSDSRTAVV